MTEAQNIPIPLWLVEKIKERVKRTQFKTVSEYITFVLTQVVSDGDQQFSPEDEQKVKARLKALGYL